MTSMTVHPTSGVADAWEEAYKSSVTSQPHEQAAWLLKQIGARYTAAALGLKDARPLYRWVKDSETPRQYEVRQRLLVLYRVVRSVSGAYDPTVAAAFLRSSNPQLDDTAPLVVLATSPVEAAEPKVLAAARAFLEG